jgi:hypothetical protein
MEGSRRKDVAMPLLYCVLGILVLAFVVPTLGEILIIVLDLVFRSLYIAVGLPRRVAFLWGKNPRLCCMWLAILALPLVLITGYMFQQFGVVVETPQWLPSLRQSHTEPR